MKDKLTVAAMQTDIELFDVQRNLQRIDAAVTQAKQERDPDLIVFPELANIGYIKGRDKHFGGRYMNAAEKAPGEFTDALGEIAKASGAYIISGMAELHPTIPATLY